MKKLDNNIILVESPNEFYNLKRDNVFTNICLTCGKYRNPTKFRNERIHKYMKMLCTECLNKFLSNEKYGVDYKFQSNEIKNKIKQTNLDKYGVACVLSDNSVRNKSKITCIKKYGVDNPAKSIEIKNKIEKTNLERYGVKYTQQNKDIKLKASKTNLKRYGVENPFQSKEVQDRIKRTNLNKYGTLYPQSLKLFRIKAENTCYNRNGYKHPFQSKDILNKAIQYRKIHPEEFVPKRICLYNITFDSIPEFCVYLYCIYHCIPIIRNYTKYFEYKDIKGVVHRTYPDFIINNNFVEIKGAHFFNNKGIMYLPYRYPKWSDDEYNYYSSIYTSKYKCLIYNGVLVLKDTDPWVQECVNWVKNILNINLFLKSNTNNLCYGYTPYNYDKSKQYQTSISIGLTPYNC